MDIEGYGEIYKSYHEDYLWKINTAMDFIQKARNSA